MGRSRGALSPFGRSDVTGMAKNVTDVAAKTEHATSWNQLPFRKGRLRVSPWDPRERSLGRRGQSCGTMTKRRTGNPHTQQQARRASWCSGCHVAVPAAALTRTNLVWGNAICRRGASVSFLGIPRTGQQVKTAGPFCQRSRVIESSSSVACC